jgi:hypothetical protein
VRPASSGMLASGSSSGTFKAIASKPAIFMGFSSLAAARRNQAARLNGRSHCHGFPPESAAAR